MLSKIVCSDGLPPLSMEAEQVQVAALDVVQENALSGLSYDVLRLSENLSRARRCASELGVNTDVLKSSFEDVEQFSRDLYAFQLSCLEEKARRELKALYARHGET